MSAPVQGFNEVDNAWLMFSITLDSLADTEEPTNFLPVTRDVSQLYQSCLIDHKRQKDSEFGPDDLAEFIESAQKRKPITIKMELAKQLMTISNGWNQYLSKPDQDHRRLFFNEGSQVYSDFCSIHYTLTTILSCCQVENEPKNVLDFFSEESEESDDDVSVPRCFLNYERWAQESYFIGIVLEMMKKLCRYAVKNPGASFYHDPHHPVNQMLKKGNSLLMEARDTPVIDRLIDLSAVINQFELADGELKTIVMDVNKSLPQALRQKNQLEQYKKSPVYQYAKSHSVQSKLSQKELTDLVSSIPIDIGNEYYKNKPSLFRLLRRLINWFSSYTSARKRKLAEQEVSPFLMEVRKCS